MAAEPPLTCCHQGFQLSHAMIGGTCACPISGSRHGGHSSSTAELTTGMIINLYSEYGCGVDGGRGRGVCG